MPDPNGFLKYSRQTPPLRPVPLRLLDWRDVYQRTDPTAIREQATRCMNCGIPFCHEGCPLGNLIPTWNDLVHSDDYASASERLHATNNFPEFTGRLCPAPCEAACVLGIHDDPVTIKQVEVEIANRTVDAGLRPWKVTARSGKSVGVVGSGPAGMAAAQQLARAGHAVTLYERDEAIGGLLRFGIPDFKLEKSHIDLRMEQLAAEGVTFRTGCDVGVDVTIPQLRAEHDAIVLTTGAQDPRDVPTTPGRELGGIHLAMDYLGGANRVVAGTLAVPPIDAAGKHVIVLGGGDTAADCLGTAHRHGAKSVHLIEVVPEPPAVRDGTRNPWPTWPLILRTASAHEEGGTRLYGSAVRRFIGTTTVEAVEVVDVVLATDGSFGLTEVPGTERRLPADLVLLAIGFAGTEPGPLLAQAGIERNRRGTIDADPEWNTSADGIFVAGDARRGPSLIVWAIAEGRSAAAAVHRYLGGGGDLPAPVTPASRPISVH
ncbi:glutamate synthase [Virgisporangium aliadipatigenens]|uniref:Glutamate synthase n=1 Tax=Virgisporangium aliadipatigenens TaxID=741659 RepID=A0A8J3YUG0_9ACTN|nr:glutamate synthase subunit beta [Virgisporangium aliadipatigenens]GIJ50882.1 glutamate synthase [Virgisporangium aliadipatigenens]